MAAPKPHILVVPGSTHVPAHYRTLLSHFESAGYPTSAVALPCNSFPPAQLPAEAKQDPAKTEPPTLQDNVASVSAVLAPLVAAGTDVVLVMHSYGGCPGTEAAAGLTRPEQEAKGLAGGVVRFVYLASYMLRAGESTARMAEREVIPPGFPEKQFDIRDGFIRFLNPHPVIFNGVAEDEARQAVEMMTWMSIASSFGAASKETWRSVPSTFFRAEDDRTVVVSLQDDMVARAQEQGAQVVVRTLQCGHAVHLIAPADIVAGVTADLGL